MAPSVRTIDGARVTIPGSMVDHGRHDKLSILYMIICFVAIGYMLVWIDAIAESNLDVKLLFAMMMMVAGNTLHYIAMRPRPDLVMSMQEASNIGTFVGAGVLVVIFIQIFVQNAIGLVTLYPEASVLDRNGRVLFYFVMAIAEELFFAFGLFSMLTYYDYNPLVSSTTVGVFFAFYHVVVYGVSMGIFAILFLSRFILNFIYLMSGRISTSMTVHALINVIASW